MQFKILAIICLSFGVAIQLGIAQEIDTAYFRQKESMLLEVYQNTKTLDKNKKQTAEKSFRDSLVKVLSNSASFNFPFDSIKQIGRITSEDNLLNIFTWNIPDGSFHNYYGVIQYRNKKEKRVHVFPLVEERGKLNRLPQSKADINSWSGALYYKIIPKKYKGQVYYTLLGFNFNNLLSNYKLIEVLAFDKNNTPYFPEKNFLYEGKVQNRVIFEYAERAKMSLDYNDNKRMIVFDHLSPFRPSLEGQFQFYGPDFSYDGFSFKDGVWIHHSKIDITN